MTDTPIINSFIKIADNLDKSGNITVANTIDNLISDNSLIKVAQYVGAIGYVLKQHRAMSNCIRQKRASSDQPMQEVVLTCIKEYQDGQSYGHNEWTERYASVIQAMPEHFGSKMLSQFVKISMQENKLQSPLVKVAECCDKLIEQKTIDKNIEKFSYKLSVINALSIEE